LSDLLGCSVYQCNIPEPDPSAYRLRRKEPPPAWTTPLSRDATLFFLDLEPFALPSPTPNSTPQVSLAVEIDLFSPDFETLERAAQEVIASLVSHFGLSKPAQGLVLPEPRIWPPAEALINRMGQSEATPDLAYSLLRDPIQRSILLSLKKRGAIINEHLQELAPPEVSPDRIRQTLDASASEPFRLVSRKSAIVCRQTGEIIFLVAPDQHHAAVDALQCPKCSSRLDTELTTVYYSPTDDLKLLFDGNRWLPLFVRDALVEAGVPNDLIYIALKNGEDEIDLLVPYKGTILILETKDRPVSLYDAYKFSAKTARVESILATILEEQQHTTLTPAQMLVQQRLATTLRKIRTPRQDGLVLPILVTTHDVAKDGRDLLLETRSYTRLLEHSEASLNESISAIVHDIDHRLLSARFADLATGDSPDSPGNLAASLVNCAFQKWFDTNAPPSPPPTRQEGS
jgi:hypothetical protein